MSPTTNVGPTGTTLVAPTYTETSCSPAMVMEAATRHTRCCSGRLTSIIDWTGDTTPNAVTTTIAHDNPGRITSTTIKKGTTTLGSLAYTQDAASQITTETSTSMGATRTFTNDTVGRVTKENAVVYAYDAADQLSTNAATTQGYDTAGQLTTAVTGSTSTAYLFDARGNRTKATTGTTVTNYGYDQANRLTSYSKGTTTASYAYNGDGLRASKTTGGTTKKFVYNTAGGMPLILNDGASSYLYGPGGVPFEQITTAGVATYLHPDQLGSIRMITNTTGTNSGTASYTAYGTRTTTGTTSAFGYAGQYTDTETGLQWLRARYYDPTTAQFLTVDPLAALTGARYSYASGNPITGADPLGLYPYPYPYPHLNPFSAAGDFIDAVAGIDLGSFDYGTSAAGGVNVLWGAYNVNTGLPIAFAGTTAAATVPFYGPIAGIPAAIYGGLKVVSGAAKVHRGVGQVIDGCQGDSTSDTPGDNLGANGSRFLRGVAPTFGETWWDKLGGIPIL